MDISKLTLSKKHLDLLPEKERILFIQLAHLSNEITVLTKLIVFSNKKSEDEVINKAYTMQSALIARISLGKLYEAWRLLETNFFGSKLSRKYESRLNEDGIAALRKLKKYFGQKNLISDIRNNFSFHYPSSNEIIKQLKAIPADTEFQLYLGNEHANCNYYMAEEMISNAMLNYVKKTNLKDAMSDIVHALSEVSGWFIVFSQCCMIALLDEFMIDVKDKLKMQTLKVKSEGDLNSICIPFFVDIKKGQT